jgi:arylsulfatase A-like enzyme
LTITSSLVSIALLGSIALAPMQPTTQEPLAPSRPNVLIIVTDDQRTAGTEEVLPTVMERFASEGTSYSNAFATTPTCCPSRASIFTGRYSHNHGVLTSKSGQASLLDQGTTMQRYLSEAGYRTGLFGKYLNHWQKDVPPPYFDSWATYSGPSRHAYRGGRWNVEGDLRRVKHYSTNYLSRRAQRFIKDDGTEDDQPWFLYVSPFAPHAPSTPAARYADADVGRFEKTPATEEQDLSDKPPSVVGAQVDRDQVKELRRNHLRTLLSVDDLVTGVFERLEEEGELENTIVFFLSDNGYLWGEHGITGKRSPYTDSVSIPFFVRWPDRLEAGAVDDRLVATIDIAPTILEAAGLEPAHVMDGRSLLDPTFQRDQILLEHWNRAGRATPDWASLRTEHMQYVEYYLADRFVVTFREYYDLFADPWQTENLLGDGDTSNDPDVAFTSLDLSRAIRCRGTTGINPCP